jgi:Etoposide-induced protein 2.4 (EI24)
VVVVLAVPVVLLLTLVVVTATVTPTVVRLVVARRFVGLHAARGASWLQALGWSLACTAAALVALALSLPLWLVPPLVAVVPPLIWGWLTARVLAFDVLAQHASADERRWLLRRHRWPLLAMGLVCGYLGSLPALLWTLGAPALVAAPLLAPVVVWLYTVVFVFAACWFAHYLLAQLQALRFDPAARPSTALGRAVCGGGGARRFFNLTLKQHEHRSGHRRRRNSLGQAARQTPGKGD